MPRTPLSLTQVRLRGVFRRQSFCVLSLLVNPLQEPDTSTVTPDTEAGPYAAGVMTKNGIVEDIESRAFGSFGIPYTTTRVQDGNQSAAGATSANRLSTTYPYRTVGKLTFSAGYCSASLIRRSVIVTAAHCIQNFGTGNSIFSGFQFRPGHYGATGATAAQIAPHGTWNWIRLVRPASWANGTDIGTGAARDNDLAVIALGKNAQGQFIGNITGYMNYGWNNYSFVTSSKTGNQHTAAVSTLGYPFLMDSGKIMQRTDGPTTRQVSVVPDSSGKEATSPAVPAVARGLLISGLAPRSWQVAPLRARLRAPRSLA